MVATMANENSYRYMTVGPQSPSQTECGTRIGSFPYPFFWTEWYWPTPAYVIVDLSLSPCSCSILFTPMWPLASLMRNWDDWWWNFTKVACRQSCTASSRLWMEAVPPLRLLYTGSWMNCTVCQHHINHRCRRTCWLRTDSPTLIKHYMNVIDHWLVIHQPNILVIAFNHYYIDIIVDHWPSAISNLYCALSTNQPCE